MGFHRAPLGSTGFLTNDTILRHGPEGDIAHVGHLQWDSQHFATWHFGGNDLSLIVAYGSFYGHVMILQLFWFVKCCGPQVDMERHISGIYDSWFVSSKLGRSAWDPSLSSRSHHHSNQNKRPRPGFFPLKLAKWLWRHFNKMILFFPRILVLFSILESLSFFGFKPPPDPLRQGSATKPSSVQCWEPPMPSAKWAVYPGKFPGAAGIQQKTCAM